MMSVGTSAIITVFQAGSRRKGPPQESLRFKDLFQKSHTMISLTFCWLQFSLMAIPNCNRDFKMWSLVRLFDILGKTRVLMLQK